MNLIPVKSRAIRAVGYDNYTLAVLFHNSDTLYEHPGVPYAVFAALMLARSRGGSMGRYYNRRIRGRY